MAVNKYRLDWDGGSVPWSWGKWTDKGIRNKIRPEANTCYAEAVAVGEEYEDSLNTAHVSERKHLNVILQQAT